MQVDGLAHFEILVSGSRLHGRDVQPNDGGACELLRSRLHPQLGSPDVHYLPAVTQREGFDVS